MEFLLLCFQLVEDSMIKLDRICREANVMLIFSRFYGLTYWFCSHQFEGNLLQVYGQSLFSICHSQKHVLDWQIAIERILRLKILSKFEIWGSNFTFSCLWQEHTVIESKPDHFLDDLRLNNPWPELRRYRFSLPILMFFIDSFCSCLLFVCLLLL